jgi:hypothetical protein
MAFMRLAVFAVLLASAFGARALAQSDFESSFCQSTHRYPFYGGPSDANSKWGLIDGSGNVIVAPEFQFPPKFSEGLAVTYEDGKTLFLDESGHIAFRSEASEAQNFSEGLAAVKIGHLWGFIDKTGKMIVPPRFADAIGFREGIATVRPPGEIYQAIDRSGRVLFAGPDNGFDGMDFFNEGLTEYSGKDGGEGYVDKHGKWAISPQFTRAEPFHEGMAAVQQANSSKWGYVSRDGAFAIPPIYSSAGPFSEGLAPVSVAFEKGNPMPFLGFIDKEGHTVIQPQFEGAGNFCGGLAPVSIGGKVGYVDRTGEVVIPPQFQDAQSFQGSLASVTIIDQAGKHEAYVDRSGRVVWLSEGHEFRFPTL